ncbi:MAG: hypothetical protein HC888_12420 [Candidatus Competibacteraceae bacterium]|nr:hypothetical protein [Candidatus Competibacteraceae bacterium]
MPGAPRHATAIQGNHSRAPRTQTTSEQGAKSPLSELDSLQPAVLGPRGDREAY